MPLCDCPFCLPHGIDHGRGGLCNFCRYIHLDPRDPDMIELASLNAAHRLTGRIA